LTQILANGIRLEYEARGEQGNQALILVRGLGTQLIDWPESMLEDLAENFRVIVFDNRDAGLSQKFSESGAPDLARIASGEMAPAYTLTDMAKDIVGLMDSLGVDRAHVMGISMGGMIVQVLASQYPGRLLSMCSTMSSSGRKGLPAATPEAAATLTPGKGAVNGVADALAFTAEGLRVCGSVGYPETHVTRMEIARRRYERDYTPDGDARQIAAVIAYGDREKDLRSITVPSLVIHGENDPLIPVAAGIDTAECIDGCELEIVPGMGHNIPEELVPVLVPLIKNFCTGVPLS
jgi:pimeloyl-ACP methyl ester carboxylesterase